MFPQTGMTFGFFTNEIIHAMRCSLFYKNKKIDIAKIFFASGKFQMAKVVLLNLQLKWLFLAILTDNR